MIIEFLGEKRRVPVMCKCRSEEYEKEKEREKQLEKQRRLERLRNYSLMDRDFEKCNFENFIVDENNRKLHHLAQAYCNQWHEMKKESMGFLFWGSPGTGKSYLSFCIANKLLEQLTPVIAISTIALINKIYESYGKYGEEGEVQIINALNNADLLVLDDLGAEHESKSGKEKQIIYSIIDGRIRNKKPMIITTNLTLNQLKQKLTGSDGVTRSYDRLVAMCTPIQVQGQSRRVQEAKRKQEIVARLLQ
ncbi:phage DNA replication protein [Gottschalkia purinilytica]|uniref:Phage DNA replication protein n=2 Tax=Gottschalkia purinilytica TaxID=1503 RepID=A0A0L0W986_GOTPU|nr:phage DNA replication protein [Gottschalkia purinilytica]